MLGADPAGAQEHYYTEMVDALRIHGADAQADIEELWRRMAFSVLITNLDDHLHNHGFLHASRGQWRLAPAFDLNPFPDRVRELNLDFRGPGPPGHGRSPAGGTPLFPDSENTCQ